MSRSREDILNQVKFLQDNGIGEIILTGVNLGWYRNESGEKSFNSLLESILNVLEYSRLRLSSIEPSDVNKGLSTLLSHPRFCKYLHVPLQSGNSEILRKMKRSYTAETFRKRIELVVQDHPDIFIGTDIIAGFPGETKEHFQDSLKLANELGISKIHSFPFSIRKGTLAETYPETVSKEEKKDRVRELNDLSSKMLCKYFQKNVGIRLEGIVESDFKVLTDNYLKLNLLSVEDSKKLKVGQFVSVVPIHIEKSQNDFSMFGKLG